MPTVMRVGRGDRRLSDKSERMMACPHCGGNDARRLGTCSVCSRTVCEVCGNSHVSQGERRVTHKECLHKDGDAFSMIRFVK